MNRAIALHRLRPEIDRRFASPRQRTAVEHLNRRRVGEITDGSSMRCAPKIKAEEVRFAADSPVEGDGFEPSVPRRETTLRDCLLIEEVRFAADAPLEGDGFDLSFCVSFRIIQQSYGSFLIPR